MQRCTYIHTYADTDTDTHRHRHTAPTRTPQTQAQTHERADTYNESDSNTGLSFVLLVNYKIIFNIIFFINFWVFIVT